MSGAELAAAGVTDPLLRRAYLCCRALHARHGRTYFLATRLLPAARRPAVHALYGFARFADEIVDDLGEATPVARRAERLDALAARLAVALATAAGPPSAPAPAGRGLEPVADTERLVLLAVADTARRYRIDHQHFADFLASMRMDLTVTGYPDRAALGVYMHGSAAVIGLQMLPILGTVVPRAQAEPYAARLGVAFQLTNFLRDVGEDLDRSRIYLPADELAAFGVDRDLLMRCRRTGRDDQRVRRALAHLVATTRAEYRAAAPGLAMLRPVSRACVDTAFTLYRGILDEIAAGGYPVLRRRVSVPGRRRIAVAAPGLARAACARVLHR